MEPIKKQLNEDKTSAFGVIFKKSYDVLTGKDVVNMGAGGQAIDRMLKENLSVPDHIVKAENWDKEFLEKVNRKPESHTAQDRDYAADEDRKALEGMSGKKIRSFTPDSHQFNPGINRFNMRQQAQWDSMKKENIPQDFNRNYDEQGNIIDLYGIKRGDNLSSLDDNNLNAAINELNDQIQSTISGSRERKQAQIARAALQHEEFNRRLARNAEYANKLNSMKKQEDDDSEELPSDWYEVGNNGEIVLKPDSLEDAAEWTYGREGERDSDLEPKNRLHQMIKSIDSLISKMEKKTVHDFGQKNPILSKKKPSQKNLELKKGHLDPIEDADIIENNKPLYAWRAEQKFNDPNVPAKNKRYNREEDLEAYKDYKQRMGESPRPWEPM